MSMVPKREVKDIVTGNEARAIILNGVTKLYDAVSTTYGARGNNVLQGMPFGDPVLTRDGVTVAKRVILEHRGEDDAAKVMRQASEKTNKTAGDGTTATVVLGYHLFSLAYQRVVAGENGMLVKKQIDADSLKVLDYVKSKSVKATDEQLLQVATVSCGDANIGRLVSDTLKDIGVGGGITIREQGYPIIDVEKVNGYYFDKGFYALSGQIEYEKPLILVTQKKLVNNADILPLIKLVASSDNNKLVIIGEVIGEALNTLIANTMSAQLNFEAVVIPPPSYNEEAKPYMDDIAVYVGAKVFQQSEPASSISSSHFGTADRVQVSNERSIIFGGTGKADEISTRAAQLKMQIDKESHTHTKEVLERRYSKLVGKIAIINVGGSTPTEMEELRFRVEDAIEATKSSMQDGIVPGGATILVRASTDIKDLSPLYTSALRATFMKLMDNAAEDASYRFKQIQKAEFGYGFNLRAMTEEPVSLAEEGIWDATRAVTQTIENSTSAAGALITVGALITPRDEE
jgi:chaperonin GroEL